MVVEAGFRATKRPVAAERECTTLVASAILDTPERTVRPDLALRSTIISAACFCALVT